MAKVPGSPEEKLTLLSGINQNSLPHLVGDILYFIFEHTEIRVVDGPGDGKRDVHSRMPNGVGHISQCKYHTDPKLSVGTDETDELVLALLKFGCKSGLFVTTGRISPQAKREYLDNYPDLELNFLDGVNLVDQVLSSPLLSAVWFDGRSIIQSRQSLQIPFIMRRVKDDQPIKIEPFPDYKNYGVDFTIRNSYIDKARLEPYRLPLKIQDNEYCSKLVDGQNIYCIGSTCLYDIPAYRIYLITKISETLAKEFLPITIRFGLASFVMNKEALKEHSNNEEDYVVIPKVKPTSYIIGLDGEITEERSWVLLSNSESWVFPENLSVAEASWAGWLNKKSNTICMQQIENPINEPDFIEALFKRLTKGWLNQSLFYFLKQNEYNNLLVSLPNDEQPNHTIDCGFGLLVCWLHPFYGKVEGLSVKFNNAIGKYEAFSKENLGQDYFSDFIKKIQKSIEPFGLIPTSTEKAILLAQFADNPLLKDSSYQEYRSAQLFHNFAEIPSPIYLYERKLTFVRMWEIPVSPEEAYKSIDNNHFNTDDKINIFWQAKRGPKTKKTFLMSSLTFLCPPDISCDKYFMSTESKREDYLKKIADYIYSIWEHAKLATVYFWSEEVGFTIDENNFKGNPWIIFTSKDK